MSLLSSDQRARLLTNGALRARGMPVDAVPVVKLFTPDSSAVWLLTELDADGDLAYGLCDVGLGMPELGQIRLSDLATVRGPQGFKIAVDEGFVPRQTLSAYAADAVRDGSIND